MVRCNNEGNAMTCMNKAMYAEIGRKMRTIPLEKLDSSHEWEELVQKMCESDDAELRDIGMRELDETKRKQTTKAE